MRLPNLINMRAHFSHFRRLVIIVIAAALVVGIVAVVYSAGKDKQDETADNKTRPISTAEETNKPQRERSAQREGERQSAGRSASGDSPNQPGRNLANTGPRSPSELADTGPAENAAAVVALLALLVLFYRRSRQSLLRSWRHV